MPVIGSNPPSNHAPDFTIRDTKGVEHQLYEYLSEGKSVILNFSSTWCKPCWNYKESGILDKVYADHGPEGSDEVVILFLEADQKTCEDCLYGQENCNDFTYGNWASNLYPTSDLDGENRRILDTYNVTRFPSIYAISSKDFSVKNLGQLSLVQWKMWVSDQRSTNNMINISELPDKINKLIEVPKQSNFSYATRSEEKVAEVSTISLKPLQVSNIQVDKQANFQVYPNPCHQKLFINLDTSVHKAVKVSAYDGKGNRVYKKNTISSNQSIEIDIRSFKRGTYVFVLESEYQSWSKKIFIVD